MITETATGITHTAATDGNGSYVIANLPVGTYNVIAELAGFKKASQSGYQLVADGRVSADFTLSVGDMTELVTVSVQGETTNTISGEIARVVDREQVQDLALNARNPTSAPAAARGRGDVLGGCRHERDHTRTVRMADTR
jgi:hypothetical protein